MAERKKQKDLKRLDFNMIHHKEKTFILHKPLRVKVESIDEHYCLSCKTFSLYANDINLSTAIENFNESFLAQWNSIAEEENQNLCKKAVETKNKMKKIVKQVIS